VGSRKTIGQRSRSEVDRWRDTVYARDAVSCVVAGTASEAEWPCRGPRTLQHRVSRGMGGSALFDTPAYLLTMCNHHNTIAETDAAFAAVCLLNGWSLPRNRADVDPILIPVRFHDGWHEIDDAGFRTPVWGPHATERINAFMHQPEVDAETAKGMHRA
jgi:hypothetical protein